MTKEHKRSNREPKKPKQEKGPAKTVNPFEQKNSPRDSVSPAGKRKG